MKIRVMVPFVLLAAVSSYAQGLRAGYAKADITPSGPVTKGGLQPAGSPVFRNPSNLSWLG